MNRIQKAYEGIFARKLQELGARRTQQGVVRLFERARRMARTGGTPLSRALTEISHRLTLARPRPGLPNILRAGFVCDAGLGGLARWLRAAGYQAVWQDGIDDDELLRVGRASGGVILTTDSLMLERAVLRDGVLPALWLPPTLRVAEQLKIVFGEFGLTVRAPRCMACGGALEARDKELLRDRIPPRTYRWLDEFFVCQRCGQLFWHGTHWERIRDQLRRTAESEA